VFAQKTYRPFSPSAKNCALNTLAHFVGNTSKANPKPAITCLFSDAPRKVYWSQLSTNSMPHRAFFDERLNTLQDRFIHHVAGHGHRRIVIGRLNAGFKLTANLAVLAATARSHMATSWQPAAAATPRTS